MGLTGQFEHERFSAALQRIRAQADKARIPSGMHVVPPSPAELRLRLQEGHRFLAYSIDSVILSHGASRPET